MGSTASASTVLSIACRSLGLTSARADAAPNARSSARPSRACLAVVSALCLLKNPVRASPTASREETTNNPTAP
jgi:hypothetical protein